MPRPQCVIHHVSLSGHTYLPTYPTIPISFFGTIQGSRINTHRTCCMPSVASGQQGAGLPPPGPCRGHRPFLCLSCCIFASRLSTKPTGTKQHSTSRDRPQQNEIEQLYMCVHPDCVPCSYVRQRASRRPFRYAEASSPPTFTLWTLS